MSFDSEVMYFFPGCTSPLDLVFVLDGFGSVSPASWEKLKDFIKEMIINLDIGHDAIQVGVVEFSGYVNILAVLNEYDSSDALNSFIENIESSFGTTSIADALNITRTAVLTVENGDRPCKYRCLSSLTRSGPILINRYAFGDLS